MREPVSFCFALLLALCLFGCDQLTPKPTVTVKIPDQDEHFPTRRFELVTHDADVAFDTQTGQLCKTWDWQPMGKVSKPDPITGGSPQRKLGEFAPTCLSLFIQWHPSTFTYPGSVPRPSPTN
jgi:hypothetical protein